MARIPDGELDRIKGEVSLARLIEGQGIALITQGKDLACRCPWHEGDDTPSCVITPATNLWHCFGCDAGGTVIDWVMRSQRVSFRHACELLDEGASFLSRRVCRHCGAEAIGGSAARRTVVRAGLEGDAHADAALLNQVIDFYHADA